MHSYDVIVIGSGIAGSALAAELVRSVDVCLVERETAPGRAATGSAGAILNETLYQPVVSRLTTASRPFFEAPPPGFPANLGTPRPLLAIARDVDLPRIERYLASAADRVPDAQILLGHECEAVCPALRPGAVAAGLLEPRAIQLDVTVLHTGFIRAFLEQGGELRTSAKVTAIEQIDSRWTVLLADGTVVTAPQVVNAAGAWADEIAALAGVAPVGLVSLARTQFMATLSEGAHSYLPVVVDAGERFYFRAYANSLLASPMDEVIIGPESALPTPDREDIARAVAEIRATTTLQVADVTSAWSGPRTFAPDRRPVVGPDPGAEGFFWFAGLGDFGLQVAPALARAGAALLRDAGFPTDLLDFGIDPGVLSPRRDLLAADR